MARRHHIRLQRAEVFPHSLTAQYKRSCRTILTECASKPISFPSAKMGDGGVGMADRDALVRAKATHHLSEILHTLVKSESFPLQSIIEKVAPR